LTAASQRVLSSRVQSLVAFFLGAVCTTVIGCATVAPPPPEPQLPAKQWEISELIKSLSERNQQFRSLRALARLDYFGPDGKGNVQEAVLVQRPNQLRLETLSFLGAILIVTVNDGEIIGYHPREGIFVRGPQSKENLLRYTQIPLELDEMTALLVGLPPVDTSAPRRQEGPAVVFSQNGRDQDAVRFEEQTPVPTRWERFNDAGQVELSARFLDYISTPAGSFPSRIQVEAHLQKRKLEIRYQQPEVNASLPPEVFTQDKPAHAQELRLETLGG
jgi:outer membrane lipoprotein-sorting protein